MEKEKERGREEEGYREEKDGESEVERERQEEKGERRRRLRQRGGGRDISPFLSVGGSRTQPSRPRTLCVEVKRVLQRRGITEQRQGKKSARSE